VVTGCLFDGCLVCEQETIVVTDAALDHGLFKDVVGMGRVFLHHDDEFFDRIDDD
jgi:hypothetical protein